MNLTDEQLAKVLSNAIEVNKTSTKLMNEYNKISPDQHINEIALLIRAIELTWQLLGTTGARVVLTAALFATYNMGREDEVNAGNSVLDDFKKGWDE